MRILLAVDDDKPSYDAALAVSQWFPDDTDVVVVHVSRPVNAGGTVAVGPGMAGGFGHYPVMSAAELRSRRDDAHREARDIAQRAAEIANGEVWTTRDTDPASAIVELAAEIDVDLIVCGTGDRSWFSRLLEPSVSDELTRSAPCSVLVVRQPTA